MESMVERLHHDLQYLENASTSLDFKIMMKSIKTIFNGKGI
ncbi:MAG: sugar transferase [Muribaculum sp.]